MRVQGGRCRVTPSVQGSGSSEQCFVRWVRGRQEGVPSTSLRAGGVRVGETDSREIIKTQISVILIQVYWIKVFRACYVTPTLTIKNITNIFSNYV